MPESIKANKKRREIVINEQQETFGAEIKKGKKDDGLQRKI